jgi:hypothetical protein
LGPKTRMKNEERANLYLPLASDTAGCAQVRLSGGA